MEDLDIFIYKYKHRTDFISELVDNCLRELYNLSFPKTDFDKEIIPSCEEYKKDPRYAKTGPIFEGRNGKKYGYPYDFYYVPQAFYDKIISNYCETYKVNSLWEEYVDNIKEYINNDRHSCVVETSVKDDLNMSHIQLLELPGILEEFKREVDDEIAQKLVDKVNFYIFKCKKYYKYGVSDEKHFKTDVKMSAPSSNKENVEEAWKQVFDIDIKIPEDDIWVDEYELIYLHEDFDIDSNKENNS